MDEAQLPSAGITALRRSVILSLYSAAKPPLTNRHSERSEAQSKNCRRISPRWMITFLLEADFAKS
jgi:hypothetical protein